MKEKEFKALFLPHKQTWFRYAMWMLKDQFKAEDSVQGVYLRLWKRRKDLSAYQKPHNLGFRILRNICIDRIRKLSPTNDHRSILYQLWSL